MVQDINSLEYNRVLFIPEKCTVPVGYTREIDVYMSKAVNNKNKKIKFWKIQTNEKVIMVAYLKRSGGRSRSAYFGRSLFVERSFSSARSSEDRWRPDGVRGPSRVRCGCSCTPHCRATGADDGSPMTCPAPLLTTCSSPYSLCRCSDFLLSNQCQ